MSKVSSANDFLEVAAAISSEPNQQMLPIIGAAIWSTKTPIYCLFCDWYYSEEEHQGHFERCAHSGGQHWKIHRASAFFGGDENAEEEKTDGIKTGADAAADQQVSTVVVVSKDGQLALDLAIQKGPEKKRSQPMSSHRNIFVIFFLIAVASGLMIFYHVPLLAKIFRFLYSFFFF